MVKKVAVGRQATKDLLVRLRNLSVGTTVGFCAGRCQSGFELSPWWLHQGGTESDGPNSYCKSLEAGIERNGLQRDSGRILSGEGEHKV